ncbi:hypothetical protein CGZ80_08815 [Rhodopirellula sp. MGV]|nr:hypothetical protein CGZ80_08815 [Rhodopirellula sp. MGV]PNY36882.1 copper-binding protein [Rhodopirellula baltica]
MLVASSIALVTSSYLAWASLTSTSVAGCGGDLFDCSNVLHSRWSSVMSVPVSIPAILSHLTILSMLFWEPRTERSNTIRWSVIGLVAFSIAAAGLWFMGLQFFWLQHLCPYCLAAHTAGLVVLGAYLMSGQTTRGLAKPWLATAAVAGMAGFIGLQMTNEEPITYEVIDYSQDDVSDEGMIDFEAPAGGAELFEAPTVSIVTPEPSPNLEIQLPTAQQWSALALSFAHPMSMLATEITVGSETADESDSVAENQGEEAEKAPVSNTVRLLKNVKLETASWPLIGKPDAELVFVELFDYTCPHCQRTHRSLEAARKHFGDRLAVISLPVPLDRDCNPTVRSTSSSHAEACELAKLAVAVWMTDREQFEPFHSYLFESKPSYNQAYAKARTMVDADKLESTMRSSGPSEYIAKHVTLYQRAGSGTIPKILFPETTVAGAVESSQSFINLIERNLR